MELFGQIFVTLATGLFILLLMLLVDHPKKKPIGIGLFMVIALTLNFASPFIFFGILLLFFPFIIFLDMKKITWQKCLIYVGVSYVAIFAIYGFLVDLIPYYFIPVGVFVYVLVSKRTTLNTPDELEVN